MFYNSIGRATIAFFALVATAGFITAQEHDDRAARNSKRGLLGQYEYSLEEKKYFIDPVPRFDEGEKHAIRRVTWTGYLRIDEEGEYRFAAEFEGRLRWKLGGKLLLDVTSDKLVAKASSATVFPAGELRIEVEFEPPGEGGGSLQTYWRGPKFLAEPIDGEAFVFGIESEELTVTVADWTSLGAQSVKRGHETIERLRCGACHDLGEPSPPIQSDLSLAGPWLRPNWVKEHVLGTGISRHRSMPTFSMSEAEASALAHAICIDPKAGDAHPPDDPKDRRAAEELLTTTGCLACHSWKDIGADKTNFGGDLTHIGDKWSSGFFPKWLTDPRMINPHARMPKPALTTDEIASLSTLLASAREKEAIPETKDDRALDTKALAAMHQCSACHQLPDAVAPRPALPINRTVIRWDSANSCLREPTTKHPGYRLSERETEIAKSGIAITDDDDPSLSPDLLLTAPSRRASVLLKRHGCTECHQRGEYNGLRGKLGEVAAELPERFLNFAAMLPPPLTSIGDKLESNALSESIQRTAKTKIQRPWLTVRMPHYDLSKMELQSLIEQLIWEDRVPDTVVRLLNGDKPDSITPAEFKGAGARLATTDGFSCTSCHDIGKWKASPAKPGARGTDLAMCGQRIREEWFLRWLRNPARISPNMEMPSVQLAVKGVLHEDIDLQSRALWHALNEPGFTPPSSAALRVLSGDSKARQPIAYLMDVVVADGKTYIKPLLIALPNRVNLLWDMEANRVARFWIGDAARQYTRGKSWYWHAEGESLLELPGTTGQEMVLIDGGKEIPCEPRRQFLTEIESLHLHSDSISISHRLQFPLPKGRKQVLKVSQRFSPITRTDGRARVSGFERQIAFEGLADGQSMTVKIASAAAKRGAIEDRIERVAESPDQIVLRYLTSEEPTEQSSLNLMPASEVSGSDSQLVPGFSTRRLPLPIEIMPTAMAWRPNGKLGIASLRGRIWEASDLNGDGIEETTASFTEELAAPYGLAGTNEGYDVLTKGGLFRASDANGDGVADGLRLLASGWGHTDDYHDWAVGLPSDGKGGYYVAIPCQQDDRAAEAAKHRGKLLHLVPRIKSSSNSEAFDIEVVSSGHRFPMGLARRSADGELFVTDNQGNYNPFNELNHVQPGKFFGFVNQFEKKAKITVPALTPPSINLPHPWTRSVNGICFLESPPGKNFGPYERHLVGCEYDTRRLVRMTLQKVGDSFQGAVYPLSRDGALEGLSFLGPVSCAISPRGELYIGSMKDSGWGAGNNVGEVFQLKFAPDALPAGIREVTAISGNQLAIEFHGPVGAMAARDVKNFRIESYTRVSTPAYGGDDQGRRRETIRAVDFDAKSGRAVISLEKLKAGFVYEIRVDSSLAAGKDFFPAEAHFTFHRAP